MRVPMIAGNWKMNTNLNAAVALVREMLPRLEAIAGVERVVCPPFVSLAAVSEILRGSSVKLGAQNVFYEAKGAFTGEVAPPMLAGICEYVILGHSERRQYFNETDEIVDRKVRAAVGHSLKPILCIGESLEENEAGKTEEVLTRQFLACADASYYENGLVIAYEPIWAIGTGKSATAEQAGKTVGFIRGLVAGKLGGEIAEAVRILYGGSVTADNITELMQRPEIDGALVGGASLKADAFVSIAEQTSRIRGTS